MTCYNCDRPGHIAHNCRQQPSENDIGMVARAPAHPSTKCHCGSTDGVIVDQADVHRLDIDTSICSAVFHINLQRLERLYMVSSLLIPLSVTIVLVGINLTGCHGNSTYLREEIIFIIIFELLVLVSCQGRPMQASVMMMVLFLTMLELVC